MGRVRGRRLDHLRHQVEVGVRGLAPELFQPGGGRQHHVGEAPGGVVEEEIVGHDQVGAGQAGGHAGGVGEGRQHVGAEQQHHAHVAVEQRLGDARHLVGDSPLGRPPLVGADVGEALAVGGPAVAGPETTARNSEVAGEGGQAADRPGGRPGAGALVHAAAAQHDHGRPGRGVAAGQSDDALGRHPGDGRRPGRRVVGHVGGQRLEADRVALDELAVPQLLGHDHVHEGQGQGGVGAGADQQHVVGLAGGLRLAHVDRDHVGAAATSGGEVAPGVGLGGEVGAPQDDHLRVGAHVLLRVGLDDAGEPEAEGAEPPADHRGAPPLGAVQVGEAAQQVRGHASAVVVGEQPVARPGADRGGAGGLHARRR